MSVETLNGDNFNILKTNNMWNILDGGNMLIATFPYECGESCINKIKEQYPSYLSGSYRSRRSKRYVVVINNRDIQRLEDTLNNIF